MKRTLLVLVLIFLCGCSKKQYNATGVLQGSLSKEFINQSKEAFYQNKEMLENASDEKEEYPENGLNHKEIMQGDLSCIEGEYINSEGKSIILDAEKIKEKLIDDVTYLDNGIYYMNVLTNDGYGIGLEIYPVGVQGLVWNSNTISLETDTSKIRIRYCQAEAISETEYYYKKD